MALKVVYSEFSQGFTVMDGTKVVALRDTHEEAVEYKKSLNERAQSYSHLAKNRKAWKLKADETLKKLSQSRYAVGVR